MLVATKGTIASYHLWKKMVDLTLKHRYAITITDAGIDDEQLCSHWKRRENPIDFVSWFATKYDLSEL